MALQAKDNVNKLAREIFIRTMALGMNHNEGASPTRVAKLSFESALEFFKVQKGVTYKCK